MEVMIAAICFTSVGIALFAFWKYVRLKRDVYTYTQKLETAIGHRC